MRKAVISSYLTLLFAGIIFITGCSDFRQVQRSGSWKEKYEAALKYYESKDYYRSNLLFEDIIPIIKGLEEGELAQFYNAYTYYYQRQYLLSAHYFKTFATVYSRSKHAEEASYMSAYSLVKQSPAFNLDQSTTEEAIDGLQNFINRNPESEYFDKANGLIDELRYKKETKQFEISKQYLKIRKYLAAIESFNTFAQDYPDSRYLEEAMYLKIKTQYLYANNSVYTKQLERYDKVIEWHQDFVDSYDSDKFKKELESIFSACVEKIRKLKNNNKS